MKRIFRLVVLGLAGLGLVFAGHDPGVGQVDSTIGPLVAISDPLDLACLFTGLTQPQVQQTVLSHLIVGQRGHRLEFRRLYADGGGNRAYLGSMIFQERSGTTDELRWVYLYSGANGGVPQSPPDMVGLRDLPDSAKLSTDVPFLPDDVAFEFLVTVLAAPPQQILTRLSSGYTMVDLSVDRRVSPLGVDQVALLLEFESPLAVSQVTVSADYEGGAFINMLVE